MPGKLVILGCGSATPTLIRGQSAIYLEYAQHKILFDCGEGTQLQFIKYKISPYKIDTILISHLHGDHTNGLPGLLHTFNLTGRKEELKIFGPSGIKELIEQSFKYSGHSLKYPIQIKEPDHHNVILNRISSELNLTSIPLTHRIPCLGYCLDFSEHLQKFKETEFKRSGLPVDSLKNLRKGMELDYGGQNYKHSDFFSASEKRFRFSYFTDTLFLPELAGLIENSDILYHDSTFLNTLLDKARETFHSTASQAASMASLAKAKKLILGHFSSRYRETTEMQTEAERIFKKVLAAYDGMELQLK
ncbi:MAG: ribonuclease Z [Flavobacteriales bacterium]|nr:ribonuclease Z [Flavobacteriales bacterium]